MDIATEKATLIQSINEVNDIEVLLAIKSYLSTHIHGMADTIKAIEASEHGDITPITANDFSISAQPETGKIVVAIANTAHQSVISVLDMTGKSLSKSVVPERISTFELDKLPPGTYNFIITNNHTTVTKRLVCA